MKHKLMRKNQHGQSVIDELDIVNGWLSGHNITHAIVDEIEPINIYNNWCNTYESASTIEAQSEYTKDDYIEQCTSNWAMPEYYKNLNITDHILALSPRENYDRCFEELEEFKQRGMFPVLRFLVFLVDLCKKNNVVLGVGRGSSVASYILYLIGIHKVDSIKYELDIKEFLK